MWMLIAIAGPDKGQAHPLDPDATRERPMVLGREGDPFRLSDKRASRRHAGLFRENGKWCVDDLGSTTGTLRNHKAVEGTQPLKEGDFLQVGKTVLTLSRMDAPAAPEAAAPAAPAAAPLPRPGNPGRAAAWVLGTGSAAAAALIGLGVFNHHQAARLAEDVRVAAEQRAAEEAAARDRADAFEARVLARLEADRAQAAAESAALAGSVEAIAPAQEAAIAGVRDAVESGRTEIAGLVGGLEARDAALVDGLATATADRLRPELAPLPGDLVASLAEANRKLDDLPVRLGGELDAATGALASAQEASKADVLAAVNAAASTLGEALPGREEFNDRFARVEQRLDRLPDAAALDARLAAVTEALRQRPADPADAERHEALQEALASIAADLKDRPDAAALREQLEAVAAREPVEPDPILAQVLTGLTAQRAAAERVEAELARLAGAKASADADADEIARRVVAALPEAAKVAAVTGEPATAVALDAEALAAAVETALSGTAIGDAEGLRGLVRSEVSLALESAAPEPGDAEGAPADRRSLERAYRRAFETHRKSVLPGGRVLDPAAARAAGVDTWRDWFLIDEFAERMRLAREASRIRAELADPTVISLPSR